MPKIIPRSHPEDVAQRLTATGITPLLARIYAARGISDAAQLETGLDRLLPFTQLKNAQQMAVLLADAIAQNKKLLIVADYDADGATACAVGLRGLRVFGARVDFIVPNRFEYGYGLTPEIVQLAANSFLQHEEGRSPPRPSGDNQRLGCGHLQPSRMASCLTQRIEVRGKPDILITVDNGIASVEGVAEANRLGMQVLVTDHHLPGDTLPDALCIVNPNQPGCDFPSKHLAGVGVMFYVLLALRAELRSRGAFDKSPPAPLLPAEGSLRSSGAPTGVPLAGESGEPAPLPSPLPLAGEGDAQHRERGVEPNLGSLLDIVALGTVADVVKLDENNRILVQQGLQRIRAGRACAGINALLQVARKPAAKASAYELGFVVGPRLNAAGRLDDMGLGIQCLLTDDPAEAARIATKLDALNRERRDIEAGMQQAALAALEHINPADSSSLAMFDETWHQGVIGILASRLKDRYHRPVIAFARSQSGELKGSGRSIHGLHLRDALDLVSRRHPHLLQKFGGHAMAAGLSIREEHFDEFRSAFEAIAQSLLSPADLTKVIETDGALAPADFSLDIARSLEQQVWGQGFPQPLFEGAFTVQNQRVVGEKHLKLALRPGSGQELSTAASAYDAIHFFSTDPLPECIHAVYSLGANEYNGSVNLQLIIRHWQTAGEE